MAAAAVSAEFLWTVFVLGLAMGTADLLNDTAAAAAAVLSEGITIEHPIKTFSLTTFYVQEPLHWIAVSVETHTTVVII